MSNIAKEEINGHPIGSMEAHCEGNVSAFQREITGISPLALSSTKTLQIFNMFTTYTQILRFLFLFLFCFYKEVHEEDTNPYTTKAGMPF